MVEPLSKTSDVMVSLNQISHFSLQEKAQFLEERATLKATCATDLYVLRLFELANSYAEVWYDKDLLWSGVAKIRYFSKNEFLKHKNPRLQWKLAYEQD